MSSAVEPALGARVGRGAVWSGATSLLVRVVSFVVMAVVAHLVAPSEFGVFAVAITVGTIVFSVGDLGVAAMLARADADTDEYAPTVTTVSILTGLTFATLMVLTAEPLAASLGSPSAAGPIKVLALSVVLTGAFAAPGAQLVREFRQRSVFTANVVGTIVGSATLVALAAKQDGAMAFAWSRVVTQLVVGSVMVLSLDRRYLPGLNRRILRPLLRYGLPLAGANLVGYTLLNVDYAVVGRRLGATELGIYMLAFNIASWPTGLLGAMVNGVGMTTFSRLTQHRDEFQRYLCRALQLLALVGFPISALTAVLARPLVTVVYGARWASAAPVLSVLALYGACFVVSLLFGNVLSGTGRSRALFLVQVMWLVALVPSMLIGVYLDGTVGAAVAHVVVMLALVIPTYTWFVLRASGAQVRSLLGAMARPALGGLAAAAAAAAVARLMPVPLLELLVGGAAGVAVYLVVIAPHVRDLLARLRAQRQPRMAPAPETLVPAGTPVQA